MTGIGAGEIDFGVRESGISGTDHHAADDALRGGLAPGR
jgi:hypothetical protein